jgi:bacterioferritin-associated ferredoxin
MVDATTFVTELEGKHQESFRQLVAAYLSGLAKEGMSVSDALKLELRAVVEALEVAALWLPDSEELPMKIALGSRCGDCAQHFERIAERLAALGVPLDSFDPRHGGYSKLFAFFRSLQTTEERSAAGFLTLGGLTVTRFQALAAWCEEKGDPETAALYRGLLSDDERRHVAAGRQMLVSVAEAEESQARGRRSTYRTVEVVGEVQDPALLRKFLLRSVRKP